MKLADLKPKNVDFELCGLALTYRPSTIADDLKARELCGGQKELAAAFENYDFEKLSLIAWYQLGIESQRKISESVEGIYIDPLSGDEKTANLTPLDKFRHLFVGIGDQITLIVNLIKCRGINIPDLGDEKELEKWVDQLREALPSIGQ